jgi:hypothetical protein
VVTRRAYSEGCLNVILDHHLPYPGIHLEVGIHHEVPPLDVARHLADGVLHACLLVRAQTLHVTRQASAWRTVHAYERLLLQVVHVEGMLHHVTERAVVHAVRTRDAVEVLMGVTRLGR